MPAARSDHSYVYGIDLLRFSAATIVALFHFTWLDPGESMVAFFGWVGVEVFFVISGLVIANSADGVTPKAFLKGRVLRLYPAAIACTVISALFLWGALGGEGLAVGDMIRSATLWIHGPWLSGAYWTLPVEMAFYATVLLLLAMDRLRRISVLACVMTIACAPCLLLVYAHSLGLVWLPNLNYASGMVDISLLLHGEYFALGIFIFLLRTRRLSGFEYFCFVLALLDGSLEILVMSLHHSSYHVGYIPALTIFSAAWPIWMGSVALLLLSTLYADRFPANPRLRATVRQLGLMTYPLYLMHTNIGGRVIADLTRAGIWRPASVVAALAASMLAAFIVSAFVEPKIRAVFKTWMRLPARRLSPQ